MKSIKTRKKLISLPKLKDKAWKLISIHVRYGGKGINHFELQQCYTCPAWHDPREMDCGHYIHGKLDYDLRNLKPQCKKCNNKAWGGGKLDVYAERLIREYGLEWVEKLRKDAQEKGNYYTRLELNEIIEKYK